MRSSDWSSDVCSSDLAVTGDLTNLSLPAEFAQAHGWLSGLGAPATVSVIAGNHDWLTGSVEDEAASGLDLWRPWMRSDDGSAIFPYTRIRDRKSVVKGKSVSVRVDLGGHSIIKKKNKK